MHAYGLPSSPTSTVIEIAEELNDVGLIKVAVPVAKMAPTVDLALFAPEEPTMDQATEMWAEFDTATKEAAATISLQRRMRAAADPRVLVGR